MFLSAAKRRAMYLAGLDEEDMRESAYYYTTQKDVCAAFWDSHPHLSDKLIRNFSGDGKMFVCDTRCAFVDFVDMLQKGGMISKELASRVTLEE